MPSCAWPGDLSCRGSVCLACWAFGGLNPRSLPGCEVALFMLVSLEERDEQELSDQQRALGQGIRADCSYTVRQAVAADPYPAKGPA